MNIYIPLLVLSYIKITHFDENTRFDLSGIIIN